MENGMMRVRQLKQWAHSRSVIEYPQHLYLGVFKAEFSFSPYSKATSPLDLLFLFHLPNISQRCEFLSLLTTSLLVRILVLHTLVVVMYP